MKTPPTTLLALPDHWSPQQALAVFEIIEIVRDELWRQYAAQIQAAVRAELASDADSRQRCFAFDDPPF